MFKIAKFVKRFTSKGELNLAEGVIYEVKKIGKGEEEIVEVDFFSILREFDGKGINISIAEEKEVERAVDMQDDEEE